MTDSTLQNIHNLKEFINESIVDGKMTLDHATDIVMKHIDFLNGMEQLGFMTPGDVAGSVMELSAFLNDIDLHNFHKTA